MNKQNSEFLSSAEQHLTTYERDSTLVASIQNGELARLSLENDWDNMLPAERIEAATTVAEADKAKADLFQIYVDVPEIILDRMIEQHKIPRDISREDMLSAGNIGLLQAMNSWDYASETSERPGFRTYASAWIRAQMLEEFYNSSVTLSGPRPSHIADIAHFAALAELGLTEEDIAATMTGPIHVQTTEMARAGETSKLSPEEYVGFMRQFVQPEAPVGSVRKVAKHTDRSTRVNGEEILLNDRNDETGNNAIINELRRPLLEAIAELPEKDREVIVLRFGLRDGTFHTLEEIGKELGVTRERIRQIENRALARLRHPGFSADLHSKLPLSNNGIDSEFAKQDLKEQINKERAAIKPIALRIEETVELLAGPYEDQIQKFQEILRTATHLFDHGTTVEEMMEVLDNESLDRSIPKLRFIDTVEHKTLHRVTGTLIYGYYPRETRLSHVVSVNTLIDRIQEKIERGTTLSAIDVRLMHLVTE